MKQETKRQLITGKNILGITFALFKSFFLAVTQVAWGLVSIFGLNLLLAYMIREGTPIEVSNLFLQLEMFIGTNIMSFVFIFFALYAYVEIKEVLK